MNVAIGRVSLERCLDAIYDAAVAPDGWTGALSELASVFNAGFADICSWTPDRAHVSGLCVGLDAGDYDDELLGFWFNRNVWGRKMPVRTAGEVISTRQMVPREDLRRSEMYHEYLEARGLHEGLRLSLWVDRDSLADISLLRPWSLGAFGPDEVTLGRSLLPHLQRAATLFRNLRQSEFQLTFDGAGSAATMAAIAFDRDGVPMWFNRTADSVLSQGKNLKLTARRLCAASSDATQRLSLAVARATGRAGSLRSASTVQVPWGDGATTATVVVQPLSGRHDWSMPRAAAALALFRDPSATVLDTGTLQRMLGLTAAEARLALDLTTGLTLQEIAAQSGRSWNTLRKHLANAMQKTGTARQVDLVRLLNQLEWMGLPTWDRPTRDGTPPPASPGRGRARRPS